MTKMMFRTFAALFAVAALTVQANAAISISPGDSREVINGVEAGKTSPANLDADDFEQILKDEFDIEIDLTECFKDNEGGQNEGVYADDYDMDWNGDNSGGTLEWADDGDFIANALYLYVKDGNHSPWHYWFDISDWDGQEDIELSGFWPNGGEISHVSIFCGPRPNIEIPAPAALPAGLALIGLAVSRRRR